MRSRKQDHDRLQVEDEEPTMLLREHHATNDSSSTNNKDHGSTVAKRLRWQRNAALALYVPFLGMVLWQSSLSLPTTTSWMLRRPTTSSSDCMVDLGPYRGPQYHSLESGMIGQPKCLLTSKWISVSLHTVRFPGSETTYDDWMWIDYHDRINVLVEDARNDKDQERRFFVFEQTKYALEGKTSWAIIGGIIEPGEEPEVAARREVREEMSGISCENFHFLGRYRTDVNRGMGWLNSFLATDCSKNRSKHKSQQGHSVPDEIGAPDTERQKLITVTMTELKEAAQDGKFMEVQWTATVAQALLHPALSSG